MYVKYEILYCILTIYSKISMDVLSMTISMKLKWANVHWFLQKNKLSADLHIPNAVTDMPLSAKITADSVLNHHTVVTRAIGSLFCQIFPKTAWNRKNLGAQGGGGAPPYAPPP